MEFWSKCGPLAACLTLAGAAAAQDQFLVSDWDGSKVVRFEWPSYEPLDHFIGYQLSPLARSGAMAFGPGGDLFVTSVNNNEILKYDGTTGKYLGVFVSGLSSPRITWGPDGDLYVANFNTDSVLRYDPAGQFVGVFIAPALGGLDGTNGLVFDKNGDLIVSSYNNSKLLRYNGATGEFKEEISLAGLSATGLYYLTLADDGSIYVPCYSTDRVVRVNPQGVAEQFILPAQGAPNGPTDVAVDPEGRLLVACYDGANICRYDADFGQFIGAVVKTGDGGLGRPLAILFMLPIQEPCKADFDGNGILDLFDFLAFVNSFNAGC